MIGRNKTTGAVPNELCTWTELQVVKVAWPRKISYIMAPGNHYDICEHGADAIPNV